MPWSTTSSTSHTLSQFAGPGAPVPRAPFPRQYAWTVDPGLAIGVGDHRGHDLDGEALALARLRDQSGNLQAALKHLADAGERGAVIQEKLQRLQQEREGRLGLARRFAGADPAEQLRLARSVQLTASARERGTLDGLPSQDVRDVLDLLGSARGVTLPGLKGSPRAEDVEEELLTRSFGGAFALSKGQAAEETGLKREAADRGRTAEQALAELARAQQTGVDSLLAGLKTQQSEFFSRLERLLAEKTVGDLERRASSLQAQRGELADKAEAARVLGGVGVTRNDQYEVLSRTRKGDVEALRLAVQADEARRAKFGDAKKGLGDVPGFSADGKLNEYLEGKGFDPQEITKIRDEVGGLFNSPEFKGRYRDIYFRGGADREARADDLYREVTGRALDRQTGGTSSDVLRARQKLEGIAGVHPVALEDVFRDQKSGEALNKALTQFSGDLKLEGLGPKLADIDRQTEELRQKLRAANDALGGAAAAPPVERRAAGGPIFRPHGTDTVPAMLTPGEYVVNARDARSHRGLLDHINGGGRVQYRAGGGPIVIAPPRERVRLQRPLSAVPLEDAPAPLAAPPPAPRPLLTDSHLVAPGLRPGETVAQETLRRARERDAAERRDRERAAARAALAARGPGPQDELDYRAAADPSGRAAQGRAELLAVLADALNYYFMNRESQ
jgi:hypothetical protein